jgi:hypothetical protein
MGSALHFTTRGRRLSWMTRAPRVTRENENPAQGSNEGGVSETLRRVHRNYFLTVGPPGQRFPAAECSVSKQSRLTAARSTNNYWPNFESSVPIKAEDRASSEGAHCWGRRMSFNTSSDKISGLRSPALASAMSFVAIACLTPSSQSPDRYRPFRTQRVGRARPLSRIARR